LFGSPMPRTASRVIDSAFWSSGGPPLGEKVDWWCGRGPRPPSCGEPIAAPAAVNLGRPGGGMAGKGGGGGTESPTEGGAEPGGCGVKSKYERRRKREDRETALLPERLRTCVVGTIIFGLKLACS
jgi:hypothetical protein